MSNERPGVLMVTGAYYPEISGAGLQCRALVRELGDRVSCSVLTTTADRALPAQDVRDGITVSRVFINPASWWSKAFGAFRIVRVFVANRRRFSTVHFHGFSQKSILIFWLARLSGKRIVIKLTSFGHDDPESMKRRGGLAYRYYSRADLFVAVSPRFAASYRAAGLAPTRFKLIPNGVDCRRFRPPVAGEREALRQQLRVPGTGPVVLFVGFFSQEKQPHSLFRAWSHVATSVAPDSTLVFIGATASPYYEIDTQLASTIQREAAAKGLTDRVRFVESTHEIEKFYRVASVFAMPSLREGLPNALMEAMASGLACIATRLEGVTDSLIHDQVNGLLVPPKDGAALEAALRRVIGEPGWAARLGDEARRTIEQGYGLSESATLHFEAYRDLASRECAA